MHFMLIIIRNWEIHHLFQPDIFSVSFFPFFLLLPVYPSRPLPSWRPCPRDLPRAPHFPPPSFPPRSNLVLPSKGFRRNWERFADATERETDEGREAEECEKARKETMVHPSRECARIKKRNQRLFFLRR